MTLLTLEQVAQWIDGAVVVGAGATPFARVSTDSRTAGPGDLFVALCGERFDAHAFLAAVAAQGVAAVVVSQDIAPDTLRDASGQPLPHLRVPDTRLALGALARGWRRQFDLPVVAVTGSNGKTTVKEMIASIFAAAVGETARLATRGNLNNDIGVPLTLLRLAPEHALAVIELGMNHPDETRYLAELTEPTIALVNNAQREHQEFMRTVEAVALEHASVIHALGADGVAVYPADDRYAPIWRVAAHQRRVLDFMLDEGHAPANTPANAAAATPRAAVTGTPGPDDDGVLEIATPAGDFAVRLSTQGRHNLRNALAATAAALAANVSIDAIRAGLEAFAPVKGRLQLKRATVAPFTGARVIDDTYNANPDSMRAAIDVLAAAPAPRVLIVGDMGEVGDQEAAAHREIGAYAYASGIEGLYALGDASRGACQAFGTHARHFADATELVEALRTSGLGADATLLVKGSRFMAMERVVNALLDVATTPH
ncbi:MAG: UDP-N-acetylmuramoyl-tripeptide--D-alanyl-D-alanine ligase [Janthinobacterium lividum]